MHVGKDISKLSPHGHLRRSRQRASHADGLFAEGPAQGQIGKISTRGLARRYQSDLLDCAFRQQNADLSPPQPREIAQSPSQL
jgi:hypothetical protein